MLLLLHGQVSAFFSHLFRCHCIASAYNWSISKDDIHSLKYHACNQNIEGILYGARAVFMTCSGGQGAHTTMFPVPRQVSKIVKQHLAHNSGFWQMPLKAASIYLKTLEVVLPHLLSETAEMQLLKCHSHKRVLYWAFGPLCMQTPADKTQSGWHSVA